MQESISLKVTAKLMFVKIIPKMPDLGWYTNEQK